MIEPKTAAFWRGTVALGVGSFVVFANLYMTQPLMPLFREVFALSELEATWSLALATLSLALSLLLFGPLSDAFGRRGIMIGTLAGAVLCTLLISRVETYAGLLALRMVQGFLLGGLPAVAIAYLGEEFSRRAMLMAVGLYISGNSLGGIGGRLAGGLLTDLFDWRTAFAAIGLASVAGVILFARLLPPSRRFTPRPRRPAGVAADIAGHLANPLLVAAYAIGGLNFFIFANQYSYITYVLSDAPYDLPATWLGMLFLTYLSGTFGSALSGRIAQRLPASLCMALGIAIMAAGGLITLGDTLPAIVGGLLVSSFGFFFCHAMASAWVSRHATHARATASSLYLAFYYLGASGGGPYLDLFWRHGHWPGVIGGSLIVLATTGGIALWLYRQEQYRVQTAPE